MFVGYSILLILRQLNYSLFMIEIDIDVEATWDFCFSMWFVFQIACDAITSKSR